MKTLNDLKQNIENILKEHPEWGAFPIVYYVGSEYNEFEKVTDEPVAIQFHDINAYKLEVVDYLSKNSIEVSKKDVNAICIN